MKTTIVLNFIRSANAPQIKAGVMMKNMPWNSMCVSIGNRQRPDGAESAALRRPASACTPCMSRKSTLPIHGPVPPKASE